MKFNGAYIENPYLAALEREFNQPVPFQSLADQHHWDEVARPKPPTGLHHPKSTTDGMPDCFWASGLSCIHGMYLDKDGNPARSWCGRVTKPHQIEELFDESTSPLPAWFGGDICLSCLRVAHNTWKRRNRIRY
jgi:hypothetical protein